jgi:hypothetical protein
MWGGMLFMLLLVGLKSAYIPNFSFLGCLEIELLVLGLTLFFVTAQPNLKMNWSLT